MGGTAEHKFSPPKSQQGGLTRTHINAGEFHFHDDNGGRKCAVDVADMVAAWDDFKLKMTVGDTKEIVGKDGVTVVKIKKVKSDNAVDAEVTITDAAVGPTWQKIEATLAGK